MKKSRLTFILFAFIIVLSCCTSDWKSPDGKTEEEIISIGYNTGHKWGYDFGKRMYDDGWEILKEAAKNEYFGVITTSEDNRVWQRFKKELFRGMQDGIRKKEGY